MPFQEQELQCVHPYCQKAALKPIISQPGSFLCRICGRIYYD